MENVKYDIEVMEECMPVRGNLIASNDDEYDKKCEDEVISRLNRGDIYAWCYIRVTARLGSFVGVDGLGGCNLGGEGDVASMVEFHGMKEQALESLKEAIKSANEESTKLLAML